MSEETKNANITKYDGVMGINLSLTFTERFVLTNIFPNKDSFENLVIQKSLFEKLDINPEVLKSHDFINTNGQFKFKEEGETIDISILKKEVVYLKNILKKLNDTDALQIQFVDIYQTLFMSEDGKKF